MTGSRPELLRKEMKRVYTGNIILEKMERNWAIVANIFWDSENF